MWFVLLKIGFIRNNFVVTCIAWKFFASLMLIDFPCIKTCKLLTKIQLYLLKLAYSVHLYGKNSVKYLRITNLWQLCLYNNNSYDDKKNKQSSRLHFIVFTTLFFLLNMFSGTSSCPAPDYIQRIRHFLQRERAKMGKQGDDKGI